MIPFPRIQGPCPHIDRLDTIIVAGFCRACRREVHDLTAMDARQRTDFLEACGGDACVTYTMSVQPALAAALIAASAAVLAAPQAALAANHRSGISHDRPSHVRVAPVAITLAGVPAPITESAGPVPSHDRPQVEPRSAPHKPK